MRTNVDRFACSMCGTHSSDRTLWDSSHCHMRKVAKCKVEPVLFCLSVQCPSRHTTASFNAVDSDYDDTQHNPRLR